MSLNTGEEEKKNISILYVTDGKKKGQMLLETLEARYAAVCLSYHYSGGHTFVISQNGRRVYHSFSIPDIPRYFQLIYMWPKIAWQAVCLSRKFNSKVCIVEGIQFSLIAIVLRKLKLLPRLVYFAQDWFPDHRLVQIMDRMITIFCDEIWNMTSDIIEARRKRWKRPCKPKEIVMEPLYGPRESCRPLEALNLNECCYIGGVREESGIDLMIKAIAVLKNKGIDMSLNIAGKDITGSTSGKLKQLSEKLGVADKVIFHGLLEQDVMFSVVKKSICGLAIFPGGKANYSNYPITNKVREYCENGMPVIISKSSAMAKDLTESQAGIAVEDSADEIAAALGAFSNDCEMVQKYSRNAYALSQKKSSPQSFYKAIEAAAEPK